MEVKYDQQGLVPAIIQDAQTKTVLMLGYMNQESIAKTIETNKVTFYSRSKQRLWTKGEESGNFLELVSMKSDCDQDAVLIKANPKGPTCHKGTDNCWGEQNSADLSFLNTLESVISSRKAQEQSDVSYVAQLFEQGINKIAQKVGEEAVEVVIEAKDNNDNLFLEESADLLFHYLILLQAKNYSLSDVVKILKSRH
ncbi:MAG: bifunctional phosphoribosyl-AMP cyclohydrolase/phosphoribosyl-ATP diphosphatase HisIE [Flavobacteriaceae bacterium]